MSNALYVRTMMLVCLLVAGCQRHQEDPAGQRMETLRAILVTLKDVELAQAENQWYYSRDIVSKGGNRPADSVLLGQAQHLLRQAQEIIPRLFIDTLPQQLRQLDQQAFLLRKAAPYSRTKGICGYMDLLAEEPGDTAVTGALLAELQVEIARHTKVLLAAVTRQLESRSPHRLRLIPVVHSTPDSVREGAPYQVEVFLLEIFLPSPGWQPALYANGKPVPVEDGIGKVRLTAEGPPGRKTWEAKGSFRLPDLKDTSFYDHVRYFVLPE